MRMPLRPYLSLLILLPALDCWDVDELRQMVKNVNADWVEKMEWLSDEVYYYRRGSERVEIAERMCNPRC